MPDGADTITVTVLSSIHDVQAAAWDACAGKDNPFLSHNFLAALEDSGSVSAETGWRPCHLALFDPDGRLLATTHLKSHSYGEYVFDYGWANAFERAGGDYYPKLQVCAPFSPVPGPRLLIRPGSGLDVGAFGRALAQACQELKLSSVHVTFCQEAEWAALGEAGWLQRLGTQFHWHNHGYASFDDFLGALSSRKRKALRKERREAAESGFVLKTLRGHEITERHWTAFHRFYRRPPTRSGAAAPTSRATSGRCWASGSATRWC